MSVMRFIDEILSRLHSTHFPEALVAGGALRDYLTSREALIKDIDVFVEDKPCYLHYLSGAFHGWKHRLVVPAQAAEYMQFEGVTCVHEFISPDNAIPVQVIVMGRKVGPISTIERHDFGPCQVAYDGEIMYRTEAFVNDLYNQTFTLVRCRDAKDRARSMKRWARLSTKFPTWSLVCPT